MADTININGEDYRLDEFSDEAIQIFQKIKFCLSEIQRHEAQLEILKTAHEAYMRMLEDLINFKGYQSRRGVSN
jgi:hypothetical protein